jgi:uncharacterized protein YjbJ (UPF0337 family)
MNWDQIRGSWEQYKGKFKANWGKLSDDDLTRAAGEREQLVGLLRKKYGLAKEDAEKRVDEFKGNLH